MEYIYKYVVNVERKKVKNINLSVLRDGTLRVSAHRFVSLGVIEKFIRQKEDWIDRQIERYKKIEDKEKYEPKGNESLYKVELLDKLEMLFEKWKSVIQVNVSKIRVRKMKTRWGSCNVKTGAITMNLELAKMGIDEIEYVFVHEMTHLLEKSHNANFKALMTKFLPDWKLRKQRLNSFE